VHCDPLFALANVEQHAIDALFCAGPGIKIVTEQFVTVLAAGVHHNLPACKMGVPERRGHVDNCFGFEIGRHLRWLEQALE
jgi:hypothetical protein